MKLQEVFELKNEQLHESLVRQALAAAGFVLAAAAPSALHQITDAPQVKKITMQAAKGPDLSKLVTVAAGKYDTDPTVVQQIVVSAVKNSYPDFPTAKDILAVIGVESSFNPDAVSGLKKDPARGLMQVRPGVWNLSKDALATIDSQIKTGSSILRKYYLKLGSREAALHAFNVGLTNHMKGKGKNPRYVPKIDKEKSMYGDI